jgi:acyl-CoA thioester hydrolase
VLDIGVRCSELGRSSMRFVLEIYNGDELLISGEMMYVHADSRIRKSEPLPQSWRDVLIAFEKGSPVKL